MGESGDGLFLQFLVPCDGLVCDGVRGCAGFFPDELSGAPAHHRRVAKLSQGGVKRQDAKTGVWWQVMDQGDRKGNFLEAKASTMFVYAPAKGVNHGYLSHEYVPAIEKGYVGILNQFIKPDGEKSWSLTQCCSVAGLGGSPSNGKYRDGSFDYYIGEPIVNNDLKGVGSFILAGIEVRDKHGLFARICFNPSSPFYLFDI